ncbi:MAG: hypothetical protein ACYDBQ_06900 [Thermoplasmatota archaeon]
MDQRAILMECLEIHKLLLKVEQKVHLQEQRRLPEAVHIPSAPWPAA